METDTDNWSQGRQLLLQRCKSRALSCLKEHEYHRAFAHFIIVLTVDPAVKGELLNAFLFTLEKVAGDMEKNKQVNEVIMCYEQALEVLPHDSHVLHGLGTTLFRLGYVECALSYFLKSYQANPFFTPALYCMENLKNALVERWHFVMLNDNVRNIAYQRAIIKAVKNGYSHVLDIGAGSGILSMMAVDAGAEKVYACEGSEIMYEVLQNAIEINEKPVQTFLKLSNDIKIPEDIPEKVNLVVTEIFDAGLFGENSLETLNHAWECLLKNVTCSSPSLSPDSENSNSVKEDGNKNSPNCNMLKKEEVLAKVIPQSATVYAVPVECEKFRKQFRLEENVLKVLDIKENIIPQYLDEEPYSTDKIQNMTENCKMLSDPISILEANFNSLKDIQDLLQGKELTPEFTCTKSGSLDAFVVWFDLHLDEEETISSSPINTSHNCCWEQAIFYVLPQYIEGCGAECKVSDVIQVKFVCKGHLHLKNVKIGNDNAEAKLNQGLSMDINLIYLLNSYTSSNIVNLNLQDLINVDNADILDVSTFPILGLKYLKENSSNSLTVLRSQYQFEVEQIRDAYAIPDNKLNFKSYEDFCQSKMKSDVLIVDPVELCGLLKKNILEDVAILRMQCLKPSGVVIPGEIEIFAMLVESETLKEYSKVVSDERVAGYKISQIMNAYQCRIHQDIQLSSLSYQKLCEPVKLTHINLNSTENASKSYLTEGLKTAEVEVMNSGRATAVVYWFDLKYQPNLSVNTSDSNSLFKQAACIFDEDVQVTKGEKVSLQWNLKNSCFQVSIQDNGTSIVK